MDELSIEEIRVRRVEADQEEVDLSYARRLLQGRIDILRSEEQRRREDRPAVPSGARDDAAIVEALKRILADDRSAGSHGMGRHLTSSPSRVGEHRREAERAVADVGGSDLDGISDLELAAAIAQLGDIEGRVSRSRRQVQSVVDTLTAEVARRYSDTRISVVDLADSV
jgi:hypothetical protein